VITAEQAKVITAQDCALQMSRAKEKPWQVLETSEPGAPEDAPTEGTMQGPTLGQVFVDEMANTPVEDMRHRDTIEVSLDPTREGPVAHYNIGRDGRITVNVDMAMGSLQRSMERVEDRLNRLLHASVETRDQVRRLAERFPAPQEERTPMQQALAAAPLRASREPIQFDSLEG